MSLLFYGEKINLEFERLRAGLIDRAPFYGTFQLTSRPRSPAMLPTGTSIPVCTCTYRMHTYGTRARRYKYAVSVSVSVHT